MKAKKYINTEKPTFDQKKRALLTHIKSSTSNPDGAASKKSERDAGKNQMVDPEMMYKDKYNTSLTPSEEIEFKKWVTSESSRQGRDISMDLGAYDLRGFWKSGDYKNMDEDNHGSDRWKKPNHPTFSNQSNYHNIDGHYGGNWTDDGGYQPSKQTLNLYGEDYYGWLFGLEPNRPEHLDMSRYESGLNAPTPLYYKEGGIMKANKRMTVTQKYNSIKRQAEEAGMKVYEKDGKLKVVRK